MINPRNPKTKKAGELMEAETNGESLVPFDNSALVELTETFSQSIKIVIDSLVSAILPIIRKMVEIVGPLITATSDAALYDIAMKNNPKWWHYYKHAKKRRIRKKYYNKLIRAAISEIEKGVIR